MTLIEQCHGRWYFARYYLWMQPRSLVGHQVGRYRVTECISEHGDVAVYELLHLHLRSRHVLRLWAGDGQAQDRMRRDARVQAHLRHRALVPVSDVIEVRGRLGVIRERVLGPTLDAWIAGEPVRPAVARRVTILLAEGLGHAHARGLVHRDLAPHNVRMQRIDDGWLPRITDFGVVKVDGDPMDTDLDWMDRWMGTVGYVAPEQLAAPASVDHRADLFSLGCLLYEMLYARPVFAGLLHERVAATVSGHVPLPQGPPRDLLEVLRSLLAADPDDRPASCAQLVQRLLDRTVTHP